MREKFLDKLQNKCCICGKNIPDNKVKIIHEAKSKIYGNYKNYYFTCVLCAHSVERYMEQMKNYFESVR